MNTAMDDLKLLDQPRVLEIELTKHLQFLSPAIRKEIDDYLGTLKDVLLEIEVADRFAGRLYQHSARLLLVAKPDDVHPNPPAAFLPGGANFPRVLLSQQASRRVRFGMREKDFKERGMARDGDGKALVDMLKMLPDLILEVNQEEMASFSR